MTASATNNPGSNEPDTASPGRKPRSRRRGRRLLFSIFVAIATVTVLAFVDRGIGLLLTTPPPRSLLFPSGSSVIHESCEFLVPVDISDAGLRDRNFNADRPGNVRTRIAAVGDSFTFGWGVAVDEAWPKVLERALNDSEQTKNGTQSRSVEVLNFGFPGASPADYIGVAEMAIRHFQPDVLIVATLQGDDLIQLYENQTKQPPVWKRAGRALFPTTSRLLKPKTDREPMVSYRRTFFLSQQYIRSQFTPQEQTRYDALSLRVKGCFETGRLNPSLVQTAITNPDYFAEPLIGGKPWRNVVERRLSDVLTTIQNVCRDANCRLVVAVVPNGPYVSEVARDGMRKVGFSIPAKLRTTNLPDEIVRQVCRQLKIPCALQTEEFRKLETECYFPLDGHFNSAGHEKFATHLQSELRRIAPVAFSDR